MMATRAMRRAKRRAAKPPERLTESIAVRMSPTLKAAIVQAAHDDSREPSTWLRLLAVAWMKGSAK